MAPEDGVLAKSALQSAGAQSCAVIINIIKLCPIETRGINVYNCGHVSIVAFMQILPNKYGPFADKSFLQLRCGTITFKYCGLLAILKMKNEI